MKIIEAYEKLFIKMTGGRFVWGEFRLAALRLLIWGFTGIALLGTIANMFLGGPLQKVFYFCAFTYLLAYGFLGVFSRVAQSFLLTDSANFNKIQYTFWGLIYTGIFGCIIILI